MFGIVAISWTRFQLPVLIFHTSSSASHTTFFPIPCSVFSSTFFFSSFPFSLSLPLSLSLTYLPPPPGRLGLAASYFSVKALVPQMPKLLKSLFPARDDKKELRPSPHSQQVSEAAAEELTVTITVSSNRPEWKRTVGQSFCTARSFDPKTLLIYMDVVVCPDFVAARASHHDIISWGRQQSQDGHGETVSTLPPFTHGLLVFLFFFWFFL